MLGIALAMTSCSSDSSADHAHDSRREKPTKSVTPTSPRAKTDTPQAREKKAVLTAYKHMWDEQVKAYAKADTKGTGLKKYATADAFARAQSDVMGLKAKGIVATGEPEHNTTVISIDIDRQVPRAELRDCMDTTNWQYKYRKTGKAFPLPTKRIKKYVVTVKAEQWRKQWMILDVTPHKRAC
ncbi:hypothetical protein AB0H82_10690 [Streptomyces sp. NPDC050732]|uniref:hypothetical protein n=1 Tax=Streptomyces sp. NPDC050732 TaxID=3154632 RepID=UPI003415234D